MNKIEGNTRFYNFSYHIFTTKNFKFMQKYEIHSEKSKKSKCFCCLTEIHGGPKPDKCWWWETVALDYRENEAMTYTGMWSCEKRAAWRGLGWGRRGKTKGREKESEGNRRGSVKRILGRGCREFKVILVLGGFFFFFIYFLTSWDGSMVIMGIKFKINKVVNY